MEQEPVFVVENSCTVEQFKQYLKVMLKGQRLIMTIMGLVMLLLGALLSIGKGRVELPPFILGLLMLAFFNLYIAYKSNLFKKSFSDLTDKYFLYEDKFINILEGKGFRKELEYSYQYIGRVRANNDIIFMITNDSMGHFVDLKGLIKGDKNTVLSFIKGKMNNT